MDVKAVEGVRLRARNCHDQEGEGPAAWKCLSWGGGCIPLKQDKPQRDEKMSSSSPTPPSSATFPASPPTGSDEAGFEVPIALHPHSPALLDAFFPDGGTPPGVESRVRGVAAPKLETIRKIRDRRNQKHTDIREFLPSLPRVDRAQCDLVMLGAGLESSRCVGRAPSWEKLEGGGVVVPLGIVPSLMCVDRGNTSPQRTPPSTGKGTTGGKTITVEQGWVDGTFQPPPVICDALNDANVNLSTQTQDSGNGGIGSGGESGGVPYRIVGVQGSSEQKGGCISGRKRGGPEPPSRPIGRDENNWGGGDCVVQTKRLHTQGAVSAGGAIDGMGMKVSGCSGDSAKQESSVTSGSDGMFCFGGVRYVSPLLELSLPVVDMAGPVHSGKQFEDAFETSEEAPLGSNDGGAAESEETQTDSCQPPRHHGDTEEVASEKSRPGAVKQLQTCTAREIDIQIPPWVDSMIEKLIRLDVSLNVAKRSCDVRRLLVILDHLLHLPIAFTSLNGCAIGSTVKNLRQHKHPEVAKIARVLIRVWRCIGARYLKKVSSAHRKDENRDDGKGRVARARNKVVVQDTRKENLRQKHLKSIVGRLETILCDFE